MANTPQQLMTQPTTQLQAAHTPAPRSLSVDHMADMVRSRMPAYEKVPSEQNLQLVQAFVKRFPQYEQFVDFGPSIRQSPQQNPPTQTAAPKGFFSQISEGLVSPETMGNLIASHGKLSQDIAEQEKTRDTAIASGDPIKARVADFNAKTFAGEARTLSSFTSPISIAALSLSPLLGAFASIPPVVRFFGGTVPAAAFGVQGGVEVITPQKPGETLEASLERRLSGASQALFGLAGLAPTARARAFRTPDEILRPLPKVAIPEKATPQTIDITSSVEAAKQRLGQVGVFKPEAPAVPVTSAAVQKQVQWYLNRLENPELIGKGQVIDHAGLKLLAVPTGGQRQVGSISVPLPQEGAQHVIDALSGQTGFENLRAEKTESPFTYYTLTGKKVSKPFEGERFIVKWGAEEPAEAVAKGRAYGYTEKAVSKFITKKGPQAVPTTLESIPASVVPTERATEPITPYYKELAVFKQRIQVVDKKLRLHDAVVAKDVTLADRLSATDRADIKKQLIAYKDKIDSGMSLTPEEAENSQTLQDRLADHKIAKNPHLLTNKDYAALVSQRAQLKRDFVSKLKQQVSEMSPAQANTYLSTFSKLAEKQHGTADVIENLVAGTMREKEARQKLKELSPPTEVREKVHEALGDRVGAPTFKEVSYIPEKIASAKQRIAVVSAHEKVQILLKDPNLDPALREKYQKLLEPKTIMRKGPTGDTYPVQVDKQFVAVEKPYAGKALPEKAQALTTKVTKRILGTKANYKLSPEKALELVRKLRNEANANRQIADLGRKLTRIPAVSQPPPTRSSEIEIKPTSVEGSPALPSAPVVSGAASIVPTIMERGITPFSGIKNPELLKAVRMAEEKIANPELLNQIYKRATDKKGAGNAGLNSYAKALNKHLETELAKAAGQTPISRETALRQRQVEEAQRVYLPDVDVPPADYRPSKLITSVSQETPVAGVSQRPIPGLGTDFIVDSATNRLVDAVRAAEHKVAEIAGDETTVKRIYNVVTEVHGTGNKGLIRYGKALAQYIDEFGKPKPMAAHIQDLQKNTKTPVQKVFANILDRLFAHVPSLSKLYTLADRNKIVDQITNHVDNRLLQLIEMFGGHVVPISGVNRPDVLGYYDPLTRNVGLLGHNRLALIVGSLLGSQHVSGKTPNVLDTASHEAGHSVTFGLLRISHHMREPGTLEGQLLPPTSPWHPSSLARALIRADAKISMHLLQFYKPHEITNEVLAEAFSRWYRGSGLSPKAASLITSWLRAHPFIPKEARVWELEGAGKDFKPSPENSAANRAMLNADAGDRFISPFTRYGVKTTPSPKADTARKSAIKTWYEKDLGPFVEKAFGGLREAKDFFHWAFMPTVGASPQVLDSIYKFMGERGEAEFHLHQVLKPFNDFFDHLPQVENIKFIDNYKEGKPQATSELQQIDGFVREIEDRMYEALKKYKPDLPYVENHLRSLWKKVPGRAEDFTEKFFPGIRSKTSLEGSKGQFRRHTLSNMSEGLAKGGIPFTYNPIKMLELAAGDDMAYISAHKMWDEARLLGFRIFKRRGEPMPEGFTKLGSNIARVIHPETTARISIGPGGEEVITKGRKVPVEEGEWVVQEDFGRLLNNYTSRDLIRSTILGRGLMELKNITTGIELGMSPFHFTFINYEIMSTMQGMGLYRMAAEGDKKSIVEGGKEFLGAPGALISVPKFGAMARQFARDPGVLSKTPEGRRFMADNPSLAEGIHMLFMGGMKLDQPQDFKIRAEASWNQAKADNNTIGRILRAVPFSFERIARPMFDVYIPNTKVAFGLKMYGDALKTQANDLVDGKITKFTIARQVVADVENRFGEMNFDRLLLNRTVKTALQFIARSATWKIGTLAAFSGGLIGQGKEFAKLTHNKIPGLDRRAAWMLGLLLSNVLISEITQYAFTGRHIWETDTPELDPLYPRTGGVNSNGYPTRATPPNYLTRDGITMILHPVEYLTGSLSAIVGKTAETMFNKDFRGVYIHNPTDSLTVKVAKTLGHIIGVEPIGIQQLRKGAEKGDIVRGVLSFVGFGGTSAKGLEYSPAVKKALELSRVHGQFLRTSEQAAEKDKQSELVRLGRNGLWEDFNAKAREALVAHELSPQQVKDARTEAHQSWLLKLIKPLTLDEMRQVYKAASPAEKEQLIKTMKTKTQNAIKAHGVKVLEGEEGE